jgi:hypothetical protein
MVVPSEQGEHSIDLPSLTSLDALAEMTGLFSTSLSVKEQEFLHAGEMKLVTAENLRELGVACPSLSLHHGKEVHFGVSGRSTPRKHAEDHAVNLLSRPLEDLVEMELNETEAMLRIFRSARSLLQNVYSSFAVLVDSRLHAYTDFLSRHALTLSSKKRRPGVSEENFSHTAAIEAIEEKLAMIRATGALVEAVNLVTRFELQEEQSSLAEGAAMLNFVVLMDFEIPRPNGKKAVLSVSFATTGTIAGTYSRTLMVSLSGI